MWCHTEEMQIEYIVPNLFHNETYRYHYQFITYHTHAILSERQFMSILCDLNTNIVHIVCSMEKYSTWLMNLSVHLMAHNY